MAFESTPVSHKTESHPYHRAQIRFHFKSEPDADSFGSFDYDELTEGPSRLGLTLPSDHRNTKLSPALSSATRKNYLSSYRQNVLPLRASQNPVQSSSQHGSQQSGLHPSSASLSNTSRLRTTPPPPVLRNVSDLAAAHNIPQFLPPAPRALPSRLSSDLSMSQSPDIEDFSSLCNQYLNMLSQSSTEPTMVGDEQSTVSQPPAPLAEQEAVRAIMDVIMQGDGFLTSPMESPFDDFLSTPGQRPDDFGSEFTSPLIVDNGGDFEASPLFHNVGLFEPPPAKRPVGQQHQSLFPSNFEGMYTISPATPALDTSPLMRPTPATLPHRSNVPNGTRKNVTPDALVPLDAPVQPRKYLTESVTSRKDEPPSRKRARSQAFGDDEQEGPSMDPELDAIAAKRLQNTLAARRSRKRKLEYQLELETALDHERAEKEQWRARAVTLEALLTSHGIQVPPALNF